MPEKEKREKLIIALDVDSREAAIRLVDTLKGEAGFFKVGLELFSSCGPGIVEAIREKGCEVFLDLKLHDIPNTVAKAAEALTRLGVTIFNVHALGGCDMMRRASEAARDEAGRLKIDRPKVIGVTILTSIDENGLKKMGVNANMKAQVLRLARMAKESGLDGVVASGSDARHIRQELGEGFLIVTPGVRPSWAEPGDQKRVVTPKEAIANGADYIVVGRPIIGADDPKEAARRVLEEIDS